MKRRVVLCTRCGEELTLPIMRWSVMDGKLVEIHEHIVCPKEAEEAFEGKQSAAAG
jgi:hypothetical protein